MVATPISPTIRYYAPGIRKTYFLAACANYLAPTRAELNAGLDLTGDISAMSGWSVSGATVDVPDMGSRFTSQVSGQLTSATNELTFWTSQNSSDVRSLLPRSTTGFVVQLWEGDVSTQKMDVFPVNVMSQAMDSTVQNPGSVTIAFAVSSIPATNVTIP